MKEENPNNLDRPTVFGCLAVPERSNPVVAFNPETSLGMTNLMSEEIRYRGSKCYSYTTRRENK